YLPRTPPFNLERSYSRRSSPRHPRFSVFFFILFLFALRCLNVLRSIGDRASGMEGGREIPHIRRPTLSQEPKRKKRSPASFGMTVWWGGGIGGGPRPAPTAKKDAGLTPRGARGPHNAGKARRYARWHRRQRRPTVLTSCFQPNLRLFLPDRRLP